MSELAKKDILRVSNEESNRITKECIRSALLYLMEVKPYDKITITELVLRSGVSRMSFYRNYKTKDDVVKNICEEIGKDFGKEVRNDAFEKDPRQWLIDYFTKIKENSHILNLIVNSGLSLSAILKSLFDFSDYSAAAKSGGKYSLAAREGALFGITLSWTSGGFAETPEEMADICLKIV